MRQSLEVRFCAKTVFSFLAQRIFMAFFKTTVALSMLSNSRYRKDIKVQCLACHCVTACCQTCAMLTNVTGSDLVQTIDSGAHSDVIGQSACTHRAPALNDGEKYTFKAWWFHFMRVVKPQQVLCVYPPLKKQPDSQACLSKLTSVSVSSL